MLKRRPIDKYIRQITAGLPRLERVDTAAEIRVHLLQKTRGLMAQGFPREEAEHLAVQEMGPVAATNRALIGHIFTSSLGWVVVGCMLAGAGVWTYLERDWIFWKDTSITNILLDTKDLEFAMRQTPSFVRPPKLVKAGFYLPRGTRTLEYAIITKYGQYQSTIFSDQRMPIGDEINRRPHRFTMLIGEGPMVEQSILNARGIMFQTEIVSDQKTRLFWPFEFAQTYTTYNRNGFGRIWTDQKLPMALTDLLTWNTIKLNTWIPAYLFSPSKRNGNFVFPDPKAAEALLIAVRASNVPASELKATKLQFSSETNINSVVTKINVSETHLKIQRDPFVFQTGDPKIGVPFPINEVR